MGQGSWDCPGYKPALAFILHSGATAAANKQSEVTARPPCPSGYSYHRPASPLLFPKLHQALPAALLLRAGSIQQLTRRERISTLGHCV